MAQLRLEWPQVEEKEVHPEEKTMYDQREILAWTTSNDGANHYSGGLD